MTSNNGGSKWNVNKEKILLFAGLLLLFYVVIGTTSFHQAFHPEVLLLIGGMFGLSIAGWGDKK